MEASGENNNNNNTNNDNKNQRSCGGVDATN